MRKSNLFSFAESTTCSEQWGSGGSFGTFVTVGLVCDPLYSARLRCAKLLSTTVRLSQLPESISFSSQVPALHILWCQEHTGVTTSSPCHSRENFGSEKFLIWETIKTLMCYDPTTHLIPNSTPFSEYFLFTTNTGLHKP